MSATKEINHDKIEKETRNCLPDGLETIQDKIQYVKSCYGIIGENGNLFDWFVNELFKEEQWRIWSFLSKNYELVDDKGDLLDGDNIYKFIFKK